MRGGVQDHSVLLHFSMKNPMKNAQKMYVMLHREILKSGEGIRKEKNFPSHESS